MTTNAFFLVALLAGATASLIAWSILPTEGAPDRDKAARGVTYVEPSTYWRFIRDGGIIFATAFLLIEARAARLEVGAT